MRNYVRHPMARLVRLAAMLLMVASLTLLAMPARPLTAQTTPAPTSFDLMMVIDGSGSIDPQDFELAREFARTLVNSCLFVSGSRAGVVQFASSAQLEYGLSDNRVSLDSALVNMRQIGTTTATADAINAAQRELTNNQRPNVKDFIIVLTDGVSNNRSATISAADNARTAGSELFAIGVGTQVNFAELQGIANDPDSQYLFQVTDFASLQAALAPIVGAVCGVAVVPVPSPTADEPSRQPAEIYAVQRPTANYGTTPGSIVTTEIVVGNTGKGIAKDVSVTVPFDPAEVRILDANFSSTKSWVSSLDASSLTINTGSLGANEVVTGTLRMQVIETLTPGTSLAEQMSFTWKDYDRGGSGKSNVTLLAVTGAVDNRPTYTMSAEPAAAGAGSDFSFGSNLFAPKEPVGVWFNQPDGTIGESVATFRAESDGTLLVTFVSDTDLAPGTYSMVFYGHWTQFTVVAPFTITP